MAYGDIGSIIDSHDLLGTGVGSFPPVRVSANIWAFLQNYNGSISVWTYSCDPVTGDIGAGVTGGAVLVNGSVTQCSNLIHISGDVFAIWYRRWNGYTGDYVSTFTISPSGVVGGLIATYSWPGTKDFDGFLGATPIHIFGTIYAAVFESISGSGGLNVSTWSISDDGLTISAVAQDEFLMPSVFFSADFQLISGNVYGVFLSEKGQATKIRTYTITNAGAISFIGTYTLDASGYASNETWIRARHVYGTVWAIAYREATHYRVKTLNINNDGSFGAVIDTNDTLFAKNNVYELLNIPDGAYMLSCGDSTGLEVKTFSISNAGIIGTIIDTLSGVTGIWCLMGYTGGNDIYTGIYTDPALFYHTFAFGLGIVTAEDGIVLEQAYSVAGVRQPIFSVSPAWTDITQYLMSLGTRRGRMHELDKCEAGTASFTLNNKLGHFWRDNTAGAFYPDIKPLTLTRLGFRYNGIYYPLWYGVSESHNPNWVDEEEAGMTPIMEMECVDFFKSFNRYTLKDANPAITSGGGIGTYSVVVDHTVNLHAGQSMLIYTGSLTSPSHSEVNTIATIDEATLTVTFIGSFANDYSGGHLKKFPSVLSGIRIQDCMLEMKFPLAMTVIDTGQCMVIEHTPPEAGTNILEHMYDTAESEGGIIFIREDGYFIFQDSIARTKAPYNTSQATFRDDDTPNKYVHPELIDDDTFIYNEANIGGPGIATQIVTDGDLQLEQGPRAITRKNSQLADSDDAFNQAFVLIEKFRDSILRCDSLLVKPQADAPNLYPLVLGFDISTRLTFILNSATNPAMMTAQQYHVEGVEHNWSMIGDQPDLWKTKWQLWNVAKMYACKSTHDGWVKKVAAPGVPYATYHDAPASDFVFYDNAGVTLVGQHPEVTDLYNHEIDRAVTEFDISAIDPSWTIAKAFFCVRLSPQTLIGDKTAFKLEVVKATLVTGMPITVDTYGDLLPMLWNDDCGYVDIPDTYFEPYVAFIQMNATGLAYLQAAVAGASGLVRFGLRSDRDMDAMPPDDSPAHGEWVQVDSFAGGVFKPRLFIELA